MEGCVCVRVRVVCVLFVARVCVVVCDVCAYVLFVVGKVTEGRGRKIHPCVWGGGVWGGVRMNGTARDGV